MSKLVAAYTNLEPSYPGYVNISREDDGGVVITVRGDPTSREGYHLCGFAPADTGKHGRCTPGDANCNNYCNMAPQKGPMQDSPVPCIQVHEGQTAAVRLSAEAWEEVCKGLTADA